MFKCSMESVYVVCVCACVFTPWTTRRSGCPNSGGSSPGSHAQRQLCWGRRRWLRQSVDRHTRAAFGCSPGWSAGKSCARYWKSYHRPAPKNPNTIAHRRKRKEVQAVEKKFYKKSWWFIELMVSFKFTDYFNRLLYHFSNAISRPIKVLEFSWLIPMYI